MEQPVGLVVCGGKSSRMGTDKSMLNYHGLPQCYHVYRMIRPFCSKVFLSCNKDQAAVILKGYDVIVDDEKYQHSGPAAALLSAFELYSDTSLLVIGCDYPFIQPEDISYLLSNRQEHAFATAYFNRAPNVYEPLLCLYEKNAAALISKNFRQHQYSLQAALKETAAHKVDPLHNERIKSIDSHEDYLVAIQQIKTTAAG